MRYSDQQMQHSYRRMFRVVTADMENWKELIVITEPVYNGNVDRLVARMGRIARAVDFMVGGRSVVRFVKHGDKIVGATLINKGYYHNIGA